MDDLAKFLSTSARQPFQWGVLDCLLWCADWWKLRTGLDPAASYRGVYCDARAARRLIKEAGGIVELGGLLKAAETATAQRCDVGLVRVKFFEKGRREVFGPTGAICAGPNLWIVRHTSGIAGGPFPVLKAWTVHG